jgi:hypothetical protein
VATVIVSRWPELPELANIVLPPLEDGSDAVLWPGLLDLAEQLPAEHVVIGGVMVYLHGAAAGRTPARVTSDVDVLFDVEVVPGSLRAAVAVLGDLGYAVDPGSPRQSTHRYLGPNGEKVDVLAPAGIRPRPDLTTTPPGQTIEVFAGQAALANRVLVRASYDGRSGFVPIPDLPRALRLKVAAFGAHERDRPAQAFDSRHLQDLAFLVSTIVDPTPILDALGPADPAGHFAQAVVLDNARHPAWAAAGASQIEDAQLVWDVLRHDHALRT